MKDLRASAKATLESKEQKRPEELEGREFIEIESIIFRGLPISVNGIIPYEKSGKPKAYYLFDIDDKPYYFATGAGSLVEIVNNWVELYEGDLNELNKDLKNSPIPFLITKGKAQDSGNTFYKVDIPDN